MEKSIVGAIITIGLSANAGTTSSHLVYHCTFDNLDAITSPVVGEGGKKSAGTFVTGVKGNAIQIPIYTQAVTVPFSTGLPAGKGCIEFYARVDSGLTTNDFTATIGTDLSIGWNPDLKAEHNYKVWGSANLVNGGTWEYPTNALHRFFKVTVEMPK